ncbi:21272_t:CDS:2, partial [Gigaspora rosea]
LDSYQLRTIGESVRPKGTHGAILRLQEMTSTRNPIILEADDLFYDGYIDEDIKIFPEEISLLDHNDHLDPDVAYIFDLIRYTCEMIAKGIPNRQNSERDIDIFIKRHIFSCFDDILDSHFGEVVSRASRDRRANAVDAPSNAEGYHLDWMFTRHDLGKDLSWGREFSICERAGSKVENKRKVISNNLKGQKILRDMHRSLTEVIYTGGDGMLSKPVLQSITKLLMPGFLSSYFILRAILVIYVGGGYYASINLADFDIPTKYEELKSVIEISRIMLQVKKLLSTTITRFKLIKKRAEKEKLAPGRMIMPVREKEYRSPQKPKCISFILIMLVNEVSPSELEVLKQQTSSFDAEIAELKRRNAEALIANEENNERRDAKVKKLEARLAIVEQNDKEAIPEVLPEISAPNNNADIKSSEDKKTDSFLDEVHKKKVSNEIRQRNREKKLLRESSTKDLSRDVRSLCDLPKGPASSVTQDKESRSHKKKEAENIVQDIFDFTMDGFEKNHMTEISLTGREENNCQEKIESQGDLAESSSSD